MMDEKMDFQTASRRLEEIVELISNQSLSLQESLKLYEEGQEIIKMLTKELNDAEEKVEKIVDIK
ncbi:MAG: exodeoxyribonuclease VII small subunit [Bacilli bacterium]|nr:exodeoxyribonuclease VII small subunit [Bacilli bacterium]